MSLEECIAALPRIEKGILRDIFSPLPSCPEPYSLDLTREYTRFIFPLEDQSTSSPLGQRQPQRPLQQQQQPPQQQQQAGDTRFNCSVCKKSFGSEATWNNHQNSAKHLAAVKEAEKRNKGGGSKAGSGLRGGGSNSSGNMKKAQRADEDQDTPEVMEALASFRKVEKVATENPGMAASVLWKIVKALWSFRQTVQSAKVLSLLIRILSELQAASALSGVNTAAAPGSLTPTQISMTLYLSRLAMGRLIIYQSPFVAGQYYMDAIQGRWSIESADFQSLCEIVSTGSFSELLDRSRHFLATHPKTEKLMTSPPAPAPAPAGVATDVASAKKPADPNLKLVTILLEGASMLSQHCNSSTRSASSKSTPPSPSTADDRIRGETSLMFFALAAALADASSTDEKSSVVAILRSMAVVYKHLRIPHAAAACLIRASEISLQSEEQNHQHNTNSDGSSSDSNRVLWDIFQALLLAMDTGDFVRMQRAIQLLSRCERATLFYQDVQTIVEVASAVIYQDNDYLHNNVDSAIEHLLLLIQEGDDEDKKALLFSQFSTPAASIDALLRLQRLVS